MAVKEWYHWHFTHHNSLKMQHRESYFFNQTQVLIICWNLSWIIFSCTTFKTLLSWKENRFIKQYHFFLYWTQWFCKFKDSKNNWVCTFVMTFRWPLWKVFLSSSFIFSLYTSYRRIWKTFHAFSWIIFIFLKFNRMNFWQSLRVFIINI